MLKKQTPKVLETFGVYSENQYKRLFINELNLYRSF